MTRMLYRTGSETRHTLVMKSGVGVRVASSETLFTREYDSIGDALRGEQRRNGGHPLPWDFLTGKYYSETQYGVIVAVVGEAA